MNFTAVHLPCCVCSLHAACLLTNDSDACAGSSGKTTTAWLIRGIFEEWGKLTGMASSIEDALYADKLNKEGDLWAPDEPDPTLDRSAFCSLIFLISSPGAV